jgi:predicted DNA-binding protein (MmcQ/YjbR family)
MHIESFRAYCLSKPGVTEEFPFDADTLVYKVMGKMFAATGLSEINYSVNLKCDPERAIELRDRYPQIQPGYHMNKRHWNTVFFEEGLSDEFLIELIDDSYHLVVKGLPKTLRHELENGNT